MTTTYDAEPERRPVLFITIGRQSVGKTIVLNAVAQFARTRGGSFALWNGDTLKFGWRPTLSRFHQDVLEPASSDAEEVRAWMEARVQDQVLHGFDAMLDAGGGEMPLERLVETVPMVRSLERRGVRVVVAHVLGPERADLHYVEHVAAHQPFAPEATLIVLNAGVVTPGRSALSGFAAFSEHGAFKALVEDGAQIATVPPLACMPEVAERGLTFREAANGVAKPGQTPLSHFDQARVAFWWTRKMPTFFEAIPPSWLPAMTTQVDDAATEPARGSFGKPRGNGWAGEGGRA